MIFPLLPIAVVVVDPLHKMPFVGKLAPAGPMLLFEIVLLSFPFAVFASVLKKTTAPLVATELETEPCRFEFVIVLLVAPPMKRIVDVTVVADTVVFEIVSELPPVLSPFIVTLSAPLKSIIGLPAVVAPKMVRDAPPAGDITIDVYDAAPEPLAFNKAVPVPSFVSPQTSMLIVPV